MPALIEPTADPWADRITITKLDAAHRQLRTAIELWFADGDPVSTHTLAFAAYELIHVISKKRNRSTTLIFDARMIKDEYRSDWNIYIKKASVFFKHADRDYDATLDFQPAASEFYITFSIVGLLSCGEELNDIESAFFFWLQLNRPRFLTEEGRLFIDRIPINMREQLRGLPKPQFLEAFLRSRKGASNPRLRQNP